jgi:protein-L-isoaspartate(D-aspartate) O-methyltransferase
MTSEIRSTGAAMEPFPRRQPVPTRTTDPSLAVVLVAMLGTTAVVVLLSASRRWSVGSPTETDFFSEPGPAVDVQSERSRADMSPVETPQAVHLPELGEEEPRFTEARQRMVRQDLRGRDITDRRVLEVMGKVPRHLFVSQAYRNLAYSDQALPIAHGQTISQPYIVALMTQLVRPKPGDRALDVGTGSGYQAAVLAGLCKEVYSIEILKPLADDARENLRRLGFKNVTVRHGDGYGGWKEHAPFDVIILAAAPDHVPKPLLEQLARGGRLVLPVGGRWFQELLLVEKRRDGSFHRRSVAGVAFVPMTGQAEK